MSLRIRLVAWLLRGTDYVALQRGDLPASPPPECEGEWPEANTVTPAMLDRAAAIYRAWERRAGPTHADPDDVLRLLEEIGRAWLLTVQSGRDDGDWERPG